MRLIFMATRIAGSWPLEAEGFRPHGTDTGGKESAVLEAEPVARSWTTCSAPCSPRPLQSGLMGGVAVHRGLGHPARGG